MASVVRDKTPNCGASLVMAVCLEGAGQGAELRTYTSVAWDALEPRLAIMQFLDALNATVKKVTNGELSIVVRGPDGDTELNAAVEGAEGAEVMPGSLN